VLENVSRGGRDCFARRMEDFGLSHSQGLDSVYRYVTI